MNTILRLAALTSLLAVAAAAHSAPDGNGRYQVFHFETLNAKVVQEGSVEQKMSFQALGRDFEIRLRDNRRLIAGLSDDVRAKILSQMEIFSGELEGVPGSWVRLTRQGQQWRGLIWDGYEMFIVESGELVAKASDTPLQSAADAPVIYRLADTNAEFSDLVLEVPGASLKEKTSPSPASSSTDAFGVSTMAASKRLDVAAIGDFEFTNSVTGDGTLNITSFMNDVDGIFDSQVGIQINMVELRTFPQNNDPFSGTSDPRARIDELTAYKNSDPVLRSQGLVHLFTGVDLDGTTIGVAFMSTVCDPFFGAGLTQTVNAPTPTYLITGHEMGHNFGAPHDGDPAEACASVVGNNTLMTTNFNGSDQFSVCSLTQMQPVINAATCLSDIVVIPGDIIVLLNTGPVTELAGETFTYAAGFVNRNNPATNITLDIDIPPGLVVLDVSFEGVCAVSATLVSCLRFTLGANEQASARLTFGGAAPGTYPITATVGADADSDPTNNVLTGTINVLPAADIEMTVTTADTFVRDGDSTSVTMTVSNSGPQLAQNVSASLDFGALLTIASGQTFPGCTTPSAQSLDCSFGDMPSGTQQQLVITADTSTGTSAIADLQGQAGSDTADPDSSNNNPTTSFSIGNRFVDVSVSFANAPRSLQTGSIGIVGVNVRNDGHDPAETVIVTVTAGAGLSGMTVTGSGGACSASAQLIRCNYANFAGLQSFVINFTATSAGSPSMQITTALGGADDVDTNTTNNTAAFSVSVSDPPSPNNSGGGGTAGLLLPFLMLMLLHRRRMAARQA